MPGATVLLDSGNYEAYWKEGNDSWTQQDFHEVLAHFPCTAAFSFDNQHPPSDSKQHLDMLVERWLADQAAAGVDGRYPPSCTQTPQDLPDICAQLAEACKCPNDRHPRTPARLERNPANPIGDFPSPRS